MKKQILLIDENEIYDIFEIGTQYENEIEMQKILAETLRQRYGNISLIENWSFESMVLPLIRRKHDLVFINSQEFPPEFWIIEVKNKWSKLNYPYFYLEEAFERVELWKKFGVTNVKPISIVYAPYDLNNNFLLNGYCGVFSFIKQVEKESNLEEFFRRTFTENREELWDTFDEEDLDEISNDELIEGLRRRGVATFRDREKNKAAMLKFQKSLKTSEKEIMALEVMLENQDWSIENGISHIRILNDNETVRILVVPPYIPEVVKKLYHASCGPGGTQYAIWNLKKKNYEKLPDNHEEINKNIDELLNESRLNCYEGLDFDICEVSADSNNYQNDQETVIIFLREYCKSWRAIHKK